MKEGLFGLDSDLVRRMQERSFYRNKPFGKNDIVEIVIDFYKDWYEVYNIDVFKISDLSIYGETVYAKFLYKPIIKTHLTECIEYMIEQLAA